MKFSHPRTHHHGFTALEALIMLTLLAVLAVTSLAVYRKQSSQAPAVKIQDSIASPSASEHNEDAKPRKSMPDALLKQQPPAPSSKVE